jgi:hypothetical protein
MDVRLLPAANIAQWDDNMEELIAICGCNCSRCPSYNENLRTIEDRMRCSRGWEKYFQIKIKPEKLRSCDGCAIPDQDRKEYYLNCRVRKCANFNGVKNCAYCLAYPCQDVQTIHSVQKPGARERIEERLGYKMPQNDYLSIIEPYEGINHLDAIRRSLKSTDIIEMTPVSKVPQIVPFPEEIPFNMKEKCAYRQIHSLISSVEVGRNVSYARRMEMDNNRKNILKLLWTLGLFGELDKGGKFLTVRSDKYAAQKIASYHSEVQELILLLSRYGIDGEIVPIDDKVWRTAGGALRKEGWYMKLSAQKGLNQEIFDAMKNFVGLLIEKYGKNAFRHFAKADMRVLC